MFLVLGGLPPKTGWRLHRDSTRPSHRATLNPVHPPSFLVPLRILIFLGTCVQDAGGKQRMPVTIP